MLTVPHYMFPTECKCGEAFEELYACLNYHYSDVGLLAMTAELMRLLAKIKLLEAHIQPSQQSAEKRVMESVKFMQRHLNMMLSLEDLAAHSGQSVSYYSRLFRNRTGQSPMAYYLQLKVGKACELLDQTELSVRQISRELGYGDPYYFSRLFKKVQGVAPAIYRKEVKG